MIALAILKKGHPNMMGALRSRLVSKTTKSMAKYELPTRIQISYAILSTSRVDWSTSYTHKVVYNKELNFKILS
jgi:hypothetical protein